MSRGADFKQMHPGEDETLTWDFGRVLAATARITGAVVTCEATKGIDPAPAARLGLVTDIGAPSPATKAPGQSVMIRVKGLQAGETYRMSCRATISDGQVLNLWSLLPCVAPS
jgi:hypothetical protein